MTIDNDPAHETDPTYRNQPGLAAEQQVRHDIRAKLNYYDDPGDGSAPMPVYVGKTQVVNERPMIATEVVVTDIGDRLDRFTLDEHGFQYVAHESSVASGNAGVFHDEELIKALYLPECEALLKNLTGASRVIAFDHKVRRGPTHWHKLGEGNRKVAGPLNRVHVDQSYDGAVLKAGEALPAAEAEPLLKSRWQIINVWRPIKTVFKDPLAVADATSVSEADLVEATIVYPTREAKSWTVKASPAHRWYFKYAQRPDEALLIKCFDSVSLGSVARRTPHCAFQDADQLVSANRESVEVRCLVFYG